MNIKTMSNLILMIIDTKVKTWVYDMLAVVAESKWINKIERANQVNNPTIY